MTLIAPGVHQLALTPRNGINVYVIGDVLIDTGIPRSAKKITGALERLGITPSAIALTHAHPDHAGSARSLTERYGIPLWVGARDKAGAEAGRTPPPPVADKPVLRVIGEKAGAFPGTPVARELAEGDEVGEGFVVLDTPGHSVGHVAYWRASDRTLIAGDVFFNLHLLTLAPGLREPPRLFTPDPALNRASMQRLAALEPAVAGFGHGPVVTDGTAAKLAAVVGGFT